MITLHAVILDSEILVWGETQPATEAVLSLATTELSKEAQPHPFSVSVDSHTLLNFYCSLQGARRSDRPILQKAILFLPANCEVWCINLRASDLVKLLVLAKGEAPIWQDFQLASEFTFLESLLNCAESLIVRQNYQPQITKSNDKAYARWTPVLLPQDYIWLAELASVAPIEVYLADIYSLQESTGRFDYQKRQLEKLVNSLVDDLVRPSFTHEDLNVSAKTSKKRKAQNSQPKKKREQETPNPSLTADLKANGLSPVLAGALQYALSSAYGQIRLDASTIDELAVAMKAAPAKDPIQDDHFRLCFRLDEPLNFASDESDDASNDQLGSHQNTNDLRNDHHRRKYSPADFLKDMESLQEDLKAPFFDVFNNDLGDNRAHDLSEDDWKISYQLQSKRDESLILPASQLFTQDGRESLNLVDEKANDFLYESFLVSLGQAAKFCKQIKADVRPRSSFDFSLDRQAAFEFITVTAPLLERAGFGVMLPRWWLKGAQKPRPKAMADPPLMRVNAGFGGNTLVDFKWKIALGESELSVDELKAIGAMKIPLINLRGKWMHVDKDEIDRAIGFIKNNPDCKATISDILKMGLNADSLFSSFGEPLHACVDEGISDWLQQLLNQIRTPDLADYLETPEEFVGKLRPYQRRGFSWLCFLAKFGIGACLADDMGLGKTIQALAMIQEQKNNGENQPVLVICPATVMTNWVREAQCFTPGLKVLKHHGGKRQKHAKFLKQVTDFDIVVSTYALAYKDSVYLGDVSWSGIILDEAQNIKNPETLHAGALNSMKSRYRVTLTGTPVENSVRDLWSIMNFLNPGVLGEEVDFKSRYFLPIHVENNQKVRQQLVEITKPFILRRLKSDKAIIKDLPDKQEMKSYCQLTQEQATLYSGIVQDFKNQAEDGKPTLALIFSTLTRLKQICNHPAHLLKDNSSLGGRSGKMERLVEIVAEILANKEKVLIFSQYKEMGELIKKHCEAVFDVAVLFLHGGLLNDERDVLVQRFQKIDGPPVFVLSLKAGGVGINLTQANHVIHYDRWWNPAVENQATDRAYRIGQTKNVQVRKLICAGTLEDKIDRVLESKMQMANDIIGSRESWFGDLSADQLEDLMALDNIDDYDLSH